MFSESFFCDLNPYASDTSAEKENKKTISVQNMACLFKMWLANIDLKLLKSAIKLL